MYGGRRMNKLTLIIPALGVLLLVSMGTMAQGRSALAARSKKIEDTLKIKEAEWTSKRQYSTPDHSFHAWTPKGAGDDPRDPNQIIYSLYEFDSPTEAYQFMHSTTSSIGPGRLVKGFGEEAEIWDNAGPHGETTINFRIGSEVILISGPSSALVKRFARHIAATLATN